MGQDKILIKKQRWYLGGIASGMAVCVTHPLDLLKVVNILIIFVFQDLRVRGEDLIF
jgi:hypothetical protein